MPDEIAQVSRPVRRLLGFAKVLLEPGQSASVTFEAHTDCLAFAGLDQQLIVEPRRMLFAAGPSSEDLPTALHLDLAGPGRTLDRRRMFAVPHRVEHEGGTAETR